MKINLDEDDIIVISFCLGYAMSSPIKKEKIMATTNKITSQLIKQTEKEIKKELRRK